MIPEWNTTTLYFSELLCKRYSTIFYQITQILERHRIKYGLLSHTKDIWCRDYMPLQIGEEQFVQFTYRPSYLKKSFHLQSDPRIVNNVLGIKPYYSHINLDGGNIVYSNDIACLTDRLFYENGCNNSSEKELLIEEIKQILSLKEIFVFPKQPYDWLGHIDSMVRFIDDRTILVNDFSRESKTFKKKLEKTLSNLPLKVYKLKIDFQNKYSWAYLNYIHIENIIIIPILSISEENKIIQQFEHFFEKCLIYCIESKELIKEEGALHCISWNRRL